MPRTTARVPSAIAARRSTSQQGVHDRPRHLRVAAVGLFRRDLHRHRSRRPAQPRGRRRPVAAALGRAAVFGDVSGVADQRSHGPTTRAATPCRRPTATRRAGSASESGRALRSRFPDGHRVLQSHRFHGGWSFSEINFYPKAGIVAAARPSVLFAKGGHDDVQDGDEDFCQRRHSLQLHASGLPEVSLARGHEPWQGQRYDDRQRLLRLRQHADVPLAGGLRRQHGAARRSITTTRTRSRDDRWHVFGGITLQPNQHLTRTSKSTPSASIAPIHRRARLQRQHLNSKTTYQFDKHFLVRSWRSTTALSTAS